MAFARPCGLPRRLNMLPISILGHWSAPNPWKVLMVCEELDVPYTHQIIEFTDVKSPSMTDINPNGRLPAIEDPNTGIKLWESGAIILYLVEHYDRTHRISYNNALYRAHTQQWLFFQASGQGPYFGQLTWFARFHQEKVPSAIERYAAEAERIINVLDKQLCQSDWLVGDKCTYADLSFVTWSHVMDGMLKQMDRKSVLDQHPFYLEWLRKMGERPSVSKCIEAIRKGRLEHGLPP